VHRCSHRTAPMARCQHTDHFWQSSINARPCAFIWPANYMLMQPRTHHCSERRRPAAQENREAKRREKEYGDILIHKYYAEQRHMDSAAASSLKDDGRRREREARERQAEHDMVERMYRARAKVFVDAGASACCRANYRIALAAYAGVARVWQKRKC
jgi:hypothetical protein